MKYILDDHAEILAVIEAETDAYLRRDYAEWERHWCDGPEIRRVHSHSGTGVAILQGDEIRTQMARFLETDTDWSPPEAVRRENIEFVVSAEMAWVTYVQIGDTSGKLTEMSGRYHEVKILQKQGGVWKIACIISNQLRLDHVSGPLIEVDGAGRILWMNDAAQARFPEHPLLGQRGTQIQAKDAEAQRDLLEAIAWTGEIRDRQTPCSVEEAVTRAISLGQDDTGLVHICWAVLKDGKLLITFDDADRLDRELSGAARLYGLSDVQERLARQIIEGHDLTSAADALGISPNTAKTHLRRIFDKTGVRTQPALVRLLLSTDRVGV